MKDKIEKAKQKAEAELQAKIEKSKQPGVDIREIFTDEDFDEICRRNEFFNGRSVDLTKAQCHKKLEQAARWLDKNCLEVIGIDIEPISKSRPNAIICVDIQRLSSLRDKELRAFTAMCALADTVFISGLQGATVRFTFGVEGVWQK